MSLSQVVFALFLLLGLTVCTKNAPTKDNPLSKVSYHYEIIACSTFTDQAQSLTEKRFRIHRPDGFNTYAQLILCDKPEPRPVVVVTMPYAGINWTDEPIDARWNDYPLKSDFQYPDVDGPNYQGTGDIVYEKTDLSKVLDLVRIHLTNHFSVLLIYGRFYVGGTVLDDIEDMKAGMWLLAEQTEIDKSRVALFGSSWGGFEALYATTVADPRAPALAVAAIAPPIDFESWYSHALSRSGDALSFLEPYNRRLLAATKGVPGVGNFQSLRAQDLYSKVPVATLLLHDDWDNLIPVSQTRNFITLCGGDVVYWPRATPPDPAIPTHGPIMDDSLLAIPFLYAYTYLHLRLATANQTYISELVNSGSLEKHLSVVRTAQLAGRDVSFLAPRLIELCDPLLIVVDIGISPPLTLTGAQLVATSVNRVWETQYTPETIRDSLLTGLPNN